jgi:hypothetical protein
LGVGVGSIYIYIYKRGDIQRQVISVCAVCILVPISSAKVAKDGVLLAALVAGASAASDR